MITLPLFSLVPEFFLKFSALNYSVLEFSAAAHLYYNLLLAVLFICIAYFGCRQIFIASYNHLQARRISPEVCEVMVFAAGALYFILSFFTVPEPYYLIHFSGISIGEMFVLVAIFISLEGMFFARTQKRLERQFAGLSSPISEDSCESSEVEAASAHVAEHVGSLLQGVRGKEQFQSYINMGLIFIAASSLVYWLKGGATVLDGLSVAATILVLSVLTRVLPLQPSVKSAAIVSLLFKGVLVREASALGRLDSVSTIAVDFSSDCPPGQPNVKEISVLDDRLERGAMLSSILSLLAFSDEKVDVAVCDFICEEFDDPALYEVRDVQFYPDMGICGTIEGTEFSFGSEEFLVERGVLIDSSEAIFSEEARKSGEIVRYAALADNVVVRVVLHKSFLVDGRQMFEKLSRMGKRVVLLSKDESSRIDELGKSLGLELSDIFGGLSQKAYLEKLKSLAPLAFYINEKTDDKLLAEAEVVITPFNKLTWNLEEGHYTLLKRDARNVLNIFSVHSVLRSFQSIGITSAVFLLILLVPLGFFNFLGLATTGVLMLVFSLSLSAFAALVIRREVSLPPQKRRFSVFPPFAWNIKKLSYSKH